MKWRSRIFSHYSHGHLQKFLTSEMRTTTLLESIFPKIEKYIKRFGWDICLLNLPKEKHVFSHQSLCDDLFNQWEKYNEEHAKDETPSSPKI
jgi:hypothetical protein